MGLCSYLLCLLVSFGSITAFGHREVLFGLCLIMMCFGVEFWWLVADSHVCWKLGPFFCLFSQTKPTKHMFSELVLADPRKRPTDQMSSKAGHFGGCRDCDEHCGALGEKLAAAAFIYLVFSQAFVGKTIYPNWLKKKYIYILLLFEGFKPSTRKGWLRGCFWKEET